MGHSILPNFDKFVNCGTLSNGSSPKILLIHWKYTQGHVLILTKIMKKYSKELRFSEIQVGHNLPQLRNPANMAIVLITLSLFYFS